MMPTLASTSNTSAAAADGAAAGVVGCCCYGDAWKRGKQDGAGDSDGGESETHGTSQSCQEIDCAGRDGGGLCFRGGVSACDVATDGALACLRRKRPSKYRAPKFLGGGVEEHRRNEALLDRPGHARSHPRPLRTGERTDQRK